MGDDSLKMLGEASWILLSYRRYYFNYSGGLPNEVLHAFSAAPTVQFLTNGSQEQNDNLFNLIHEGDRRQWVICCGTYASADIEDMGLVQGHAYTIVILELCS